MDEPRIGFEPDLVARLELVSFAEHRDDVFAAKFGDDLQFGTGGLDDLHFRLGAVVGEREMLRSHAVNRRLSIAGGAGSRQRELDASRSFETRRCRYCGYGL